MRSRLWYASKLSWRRQPSEVLCTRLSAGQPAPPFVSPDARHPLTAALHKWLGPIPHNAPVSPVCPAPQRGPSSPSQRPATRRAACTHKWNLHLLPRRVSRANNRQARAWAWLPRARVSAPRHVRAQSRGLAVTARASVLLPGFGEAGAHGQGAVRVGPHEGQDNLVRPCLCSRACEVRHDVHHRAARLPRHAQASRQGRALAPRKCAVLCIECMYALQTSRHLSVAGTWISLACMGLWRSEADDVVNCASFKARWAKSSSST
jgi:hypothetical protein